jgi:addiction module RelE/StbE family toxin
VVKVSWTEQALEDLNAIGQFIARDTPAYARIFAQRIFAAVEHLGSFPRSGRIVPELQREDIREIIYRNYRIIYRLLKDEIEILTVHHGARLLQPPRSSK